MVGQTANSRGAGGEAERRRVIERTESIYRGTVVLGQLAHGALERAVQVALLGW